MEKQDVWRLFKANRRLLLHVAATAWKWFACDKKAIVHNKYQLKNTASGARASSGLNCSPERSSLPKLNSNFPIMSTRTSLQNEHLIKSFYFLHILNCIFSQVPSFKVSFQRRTLWNLIKDWLILRRPPGKEHSGRPNRVSCRSLWPRDKLIFHLNARRSEHWCKSYYPECPSGLANSAKAARRGTSKKWKVFKKTKCISYFLLDCLHYKKIIHIIKGEVLGQDLGDRN